MTSSVVVSPGAVAYYETSALTQEGLSAAMEGAVRAAVSGLKKTTGRRGFRLPWKKRLGYKTVNLNL